MASKDFNEISSNDRIAMDGSCRIIQSEDELRILPSNMIINGWILLGKSAVELNVEASGEDSLKTGSGDCLSLSPRFSRCMSHQIKLRKLYLPCTRDMWSRWR